MPRPTEPPHAGRQLDLLAGKVTAAHQQLAAAAIVATTAAVAAVQAGQADKAQRRAERLAAIEARNKHAASHPVGR